MVIRALTWNVFHGRDLPPDPALATWRSRLLRLTERNETHAQVNRDLLREFATVLGKAEWDLALLQEFPPRWAAAIMAACEATSHRALTARNSLPRLRGAAARLNPDLIAAHEGGSNLTLVRARLGEIVERRELGLRERRRPERRALGFVRVRLRTASATELCVGNLHASAGRVNRALAEEEVRLAAERCLGWAREAPLILGGDFNVRPRETTLYAAIERRYGLRGVTAPEAIDHILARGLEAIGRPRAWAPEQREFTAGGLAIRLSDHAPVEATFELRAPAGEPASPPRAARTGR